MRREKTIGLILTVAGFAAMIGCTLTTSLDGLSDGQRPDGGSPDGGSPDAAMDAHHDADAPDAGCESDYVAAVLADEPAVFYPLDDHGPAASDHSGHGLDGIYGADVRTRFPGLLGEGCGFAAEFPGGAPGADPKSVQTPRDALLEPTDAVTMEAWIKISKLPPQQGDNNPAIVAYGDSGAGVVYTMDIYGPGANINTYLTVASGAGFVQAIGTTTLEKDRVYYVVATYDGETVAVYLDGALETKHKASSGAKPIVGYSGAGLYLGDDPPFTARPAFAGTIQNVAIYGKALSASQIAAHYDAGTH